LANWWFWFGITRCPLTTVPARGVSRRNIRPPISNGGGRVTGDATRTRQRHRGGLRILPLRSIAATWPPPSWCSITQAIARDLLPFTWSIETREGWRASIAAMLDADASTIPLHSDYELVWAGRPAEFFAGLLGCEHHWCCRVVVAAALPVRPISANQLVFVVESGVEACPNF